MTRNVFICLLSLFLVRAAHADSLKDALTHKYKNQLLAQRSPFSTGRDQKFDSAGHSLSIEKSSDWLLYGGFYVEKLSLSSDTLRLEGHRATYYDEKMSGKRIMMPFEKSRHMEIHLDHPLNSMDDADAIMERIFFLGPDAVDHIKAELRRADDNIPDAEIYRVSQPAVKPASADAAVSNDSDVKVLPPRATYTPEPDYSAVAQHAKYQGTVLLTILIDKAGKVSRIRLERPLGMGLDENAMEGVQRWRFNPATRNGEPVAVVMNIEVSFNLY